VHCAVGSDASEIAALERKDDGALCDVEELVLMPVSVVWGVDGVGLEGVVAVVGGG
jgi:hypothetical protein